MKSSTAMNISTIYSSTKVYVQRPMWRRIFSNLDWPVNTLNNWGMALMCWVCMSGKSTEDCNGNGKACFRRHPTYSSVGASFSWVGNWLGHNQWVAGSMLRLHLWAEERLLLQVYRTMKDKTISSVECSGN